ncbi:serine O-acetyltransferase [Tolypothrix sp. FACHB-123]|uniref:serine O-acetyltransferase n=1 Tax=Tolypothrix sp. FACHB-123 TaxID=2692868 RepID=UPI001688DDB7|nr:serine O-acetyltransferase [Tolypothrix sp. FACHB-123]MBD2357264.1 serine O-acetyltransferase [Tolypothrix sp. FACHB-123]
MQQSLNSIRNPKTATKPDSANTSLLKNLLSGDLFEPLLSDFRIIFERDPAARNWLEVVFCYPGLHAICLHRLAHWLHRRRVVFIPRLISHLGRFLTGIEIHPGAEIGKGVFIDHGMGVVIGETAIVGDYTLIYQGATLGGTGKESGKRHPTIGANVVIGAGAKVLGNIEIGDRVRVGALSVVLRDVPSDSTVVGIPGRVISRKQGEPLEHGKLPDVEASVMRSLLSRIEQLEQQLQELKLNSQQSTVNSQQSTVNSQQSIAND